MQRGQASALNGGNIRDRDRDRRRSSDRDSVPRGDGGGRPEKFERSSKPGGGSRPGGQGGGGYGHFGSVGGSHGRPAHERIDSGGSSAGNARSIPSSGLHQMDKERPLDEKLNDLATCLIGQWVDVQLTTGQWYTAIFHSCGDTEEGFGVKLRMARLRDAKGGKGMKNDGAVRIMPNGDLKISGKDFVQIVAKDVSLSLEPAANGKPKDLKEEIATDTALSRGRLAGTERELTKWKPEGGDEVPRNMRLDAAPWGGRGQVWDQFEVNAQLFGVQSTFDEELYTTKLDKRNTPEAKEREREAIRIAREIESQSTRNSHLAEERGQKLDSATEAMGEEARYSSVIRAPQSRDDADAGGEDEEEEEEDEGIDTRNDETFGNGHPTAPATIEPKSPPQSSIVLGKSLSSSALSTPVRIGADGEQRAANGVLKDGQSPVRDRRTTSAEKSDWVMGDGLAKLRLRLNTSVKGSTKGGRSPYHSPMGRSPLMSPLVGDAALIHVLNLDPSCPNVSEDVVRDFHEFKNAKAGKRRFDEELNDFKSFSQSLKDRSVEPRSPLAAARHLLVTSASPAGSRPSSSGSVRSAQPALSVSTSSGGLSGLSVPMPPTSSSLSAPSVEMASAPVKLDKAGSTPSTLQAGATTPAVTATGPSSLGVAPSTASSTNIVSPTSSAASSAASTGSNGASSKKSSSLNPHAKEFKLNPNAKAFTPNVTTPARPAVPAAPQIAPAPPPQHTVPPPSGPSVFVPSGMPHNVGIPLSPIPQFVPPGQQFPNYQTAVVNAAPGTYPISLPSGFLQQGVPQATAVAWMGAEQVAGQMFAQQQLRGFTPQGPHMQPQFIYPTGQLPQYPPPGAMYGQGQPVVLFHMTPGQMQQQHVLTQQAVPQQPGPPPPQGGLQYQPSPQIMGGAGQHGMQHPHMPPHMQGPMQGQQMGQGMPGGPGGANSGGRRGGSGGGQQQQLLQQ